MPAYERQVEAQAKVNLSLEVLGCRPDGYHELLTLMASARLADRLFLSLKSGGENWSLTSNSPGLPSGEDNLAFRAAERFFSLLSLHPQTVSFRIHIEKSIPAAAGLGGGSADAAAVLRFLWQAWGEGLAESLGFPRDRLTMADLDRAALSLGADVPFCLHGGIRLCRGIGEILSEPLAGPAWPLLIGKPRASIRTAEAFALLARQRGGKVPDAGEEVFARWQKVLEEADALAALHLIRNDFLPVATQMVPQVQTVLDMLLAEGAFAASLSGSGPSCFGLFEDEDRLEKASRELSSRMPDVRWIKSALAPEPALSED